MNKKILVTGFEPFDGDATNPSQELLSWFNQQTFSCELHTLELPVSFQSAYRELEKKLATVSPSYVLLTGFAKNRTQLTIERIGINWVDARIPDNDGLVYRNQKIIEGAEDGLFTSLPIFELMTAAEKVGCPTKISTSAGEYVCNYLLFQFLFNNKNLPGTFIHLPGRDDYLEIFAGISAIVDFLSKKCP